MTILQKLEHIVSWTQELLNQLINVKSLSPFDDLKEMRIE